MPTPADNAIAFALRQVGKPYVWGATGPNSYDCSGLVQAAYKAAGISLSRTTYTQVLQGTAVSCGDLKPGDLVFPNPGHVQIYLGNGQVVEAPRKGLNVRVKGLGTCWKARRVTTPGSVAGQAGVSAPGSSTLTAVQSSTDVLRAAGCVTLIYSTMLMIVGLLLIPMGVSPESVMNAFGNWPNVWTESCDPTSPSAEDGDAY